MPQKRPASSRNTVAGEHKRHQTAVSLNSRVRQYAGQMLAVSGSELMCTVCEETVQNIKSSIDAHVSGSKHILALRKAKEKVGHEGDLRSELISYYKSNPEEKGSTVSIDDVIFRLQVIETFLSAGVPLSKVDRMRPLLERLGHKLTSATHLNTLIPKVEARELAGFSKSLQGRRCPWLSMALLD